MTDLSVDRPIETWVPDPVCADVETWVEHIYAPTFARRIGQNHRWCARWWDHAEAIIRLTCLWQTWEAARLGDGESGMADWLRNYFDLLNPALLSPDGPFTACTPDRHAPPHSLPTTATPPGYWSLVDDVDPTGTPSW